MMHVICFVRDLKEHTVERVVDFPGQTSRNVLRKSGDFAVKGALLVRILLIPLVVDQHKSFDSLPPQL